MSTPYQDQNSFSMKIPVENDAGAHAPQAYSSTAPEVYYSATAPEVYHHPATAPEVYYPESPLGSILDKQEAYKTESQQDLSSSSPPGNICGLKRRTFWIILLVFIVIVIAAIGGGVGGALANKKTSSVSSQSQTSDDSPTPTSTSASDDSGVVLLEATGASATSTSTSTATSSARPMADSNYAIVNWNSTVDILYQDINANIRMVGFNLTIESGNVLNYTWSKPSDPILPKRSIRADTPISAVGYEKSNSRQLRVYLINSNNNIEEWAWNNVQNKWAGKAINSTMTASATSQITSQIVITGSSLKIFVFYQDADDRLAGFVYSGGWKTLETFTNVKAADWPSLNTKGSGLSVIGYPAKAPKGIRVYYEDTDTKLNWFQGLNIDLATSKQSWKAGTQLETLPSSGPLSAIVIPTLTDRMLQLFYIQDSKVVVDTFNSSGIATSTGVNDTLGYLSSDGLSASSSSVASATWDEMVLVLTGAEEWFNIWQYTPSNTAWSNPSVPIGYFIA